MRFVETFPKTPAPTPPLCQYSPAFTWAQLQAMHEFILAQQKLKAQEQELMNSISGVNYSKNPKKTVDGLEIKYDYDSDEDCEGGTWEHKLRAAEMEATRGILSDCFPWFSNIALVVT